VGILEQDADLEPFDVKPAEVAILDRDPIMANVSDPRTTGRAGSSDRGPLRLTVM